MHRIARSSCAVLACLALPGCLSMGVMQRATGPRYRFGRMTEFTDAALVGKDVFVQVSVLRPERTEPAPFVLKIATDEKYWAQSHSVPQASFMDGVMLAHVPATMLLAPGGIPADGICLPIEPVEIRRLEELKAIGKPPSHGIRVLAVHYRPAADDLPMFSDRRRGVPPPEDPLLAILGPTIGGEPSPILVSDIQDGHGTRRAWLILMPFAAVADAAVLPIEFIGGLAAAE